MKVVSFFIIFLFITCYSAQENGIDVKFLEQKFEEIKNQTDNVEAQISLCYEIGNAYFSKRENKDKAIFYLKKCLATLNMHKDDVIFSKHIQEYVNSNIILGMIVPDGEEGITYTNNMIKFYDTSNEKDSKQNQRILAYLHGILGKRQEGLGRYFHAISTYQKQLSIREKLENNKMNICVTLHNIAECYYAINHLEKALEYYEKCLAIRGEEKYANLDPKYVIEKNTALTYMKVGKYFEAIGHQQNVIEILEKKIKENTDNAEDFLFLKASTYDDCGSALMESGNFMEAKNKYEKAYEIRGKLLKKDNPLIAESLNNLACAYMKLGDVAKAELHLNKSIEQTSKKNAHSYGITLCNCGQLYIQKGDYEKALDFFLKATKVFSDNLEENEFNIAITYDSIGLIFMLKEDFFNAVTWLQKAVAIIERKYSYMGGIEKTYSNLAQAYFHLEDYSQALSWLTKAIDKTTSYGRKNSLQNLAHLYKLASNVYYSLNDIEKGRFYNEQSTKLLICKQDEETNYYWASLLFQKGLHISEKQFQAIWESFLTCQPELISANMLLLKQVVEKNPQYISSFGYNFSSIASKLRNEHYEKYLVFMLEYFRSGINTHRNEALVFFEKETIDACHLRPIFEHILSKAYAEKEEDYAEEKKHLENALSSSIEEKNDAFLFFIGKEIILSSIIHNDINHGKEYLEVFKEITKGTTDLNLMYPFKVMEQLLGLRENDSNQKPLTDNFEKLSLEQPVTCSYILSYFLAKTKIYEVNHSYIVLLSHYISDIHVCMFSLSDRFFISQILRNAGLEVEAARWFVLDDDNATVGEIVNYYLSLPTTNREDSVHRIKKMLAMSPRNFVLKGRTYTAQDYQIIRLLTLYKYASVFNRNDIIEQIIPDIHTAVEFEIHDIVISMRNELVFLYADYLQKNRLFVEAQTYWQRFLGNPNIMTHMELEAKVKMAQCIIEQEYYAGAASLIKECIESSELIKDRDTYFIAICNYISLNIRLSNQATNLTIKNRMLLEANRVLNTYGDKYYFQELSALHDIISILMLQYDSSKSRNEKRNYFLSSYCSNNPHTSLKHFQADLWLTKYLFLKNYSLFSDENLQLIFLEKYYEHQVLSKRSSPYISNVWNIKDNQIKHIFLSLLAKNGDVRKLDYWNKFFETQITREGMLVTEKTNGSSPFILRPIYDLVLQAEEAEQILAVEESKKENERDKARIQTALRIKRQLAQYFDEAQKIYSKDAKNKLNSVLSDHFMINPDSLGQISSILPQDTACLQYIPIDDQIIIYLTAKDKNFITSCRLSEYNYTTTKFFKLILKFRAMLQKRNNNAQIKIVSKQLFDLLFPAELNKCLMQLKTKKLLINSSGQLRYVPFGALFNGDKYMIENFQITNATGMDLLRLGKSNEKKDFDKLHSVIFADPDCSLPLGRLEGERIADILKNANLFLGEKASLDEFESLMGNINFIHLATHAVLDPNSPSKSYILFSNDQHWQYADMMGFNVQNVDSIVLSACSTAVSEKSTGGEIEGMAYQLLRKSPSGSVLASFWPVDDAATAELMTTYYTHIVNSIKTNGNLDRGGALREAQLKLLTNPKTSSPYYWASFTLFGDYR